MKFQLNDSRCLHMLFTDVATFKTGLGFPGLSRVLQGRMNTSFSMVRYALKSLGVQERSIDAQPKST